MEATEAVSPPNPFYTGIDPYKGGPDLDKAKALLAQAGHTSIDTTFLVPVNVPEQLAMAQVLQSQLKKIGINLTIQTVASSEWFGLISQGKYGITPTYFSVSLDPGLAYYLLGYSSSAFNFAGLKSSRIDALLEKFMFEPDQKIRRAGVPGGCHRLRRASCGDLRGQPAAAVLDPSEPAWRPAAAVAGTAPGGHVEVLTDVGGRLLLGTVA